MWRYVKMLALSVGMGTAVLLACLFLLANESKAGGGVLCVVPPGEPTGPFAACAAVFTQIQDAVDTAVGGEEIWVAAGVYTDMHTNTYGTQMVWIDKPLTLRGGYVAPFDEAPDFAANPTVLDAQGQGRVVYLFAPDVTIEGLRLTGGLGAGGGVFAPWGVTASLNQNTIYGNIGEEGAGGVLVLGSEVTLTQNLIHSNRGALSAAGIYEPISGGGVYVYWGQVVLTGNVIISNTAVLTLTNGDAAGGGVYARDSNVTLTANVIQANVAAATFTGEPSWSSLVSGGGIALQNSTFRAIDNAIVGNTALGRSTLTTISSSLTGGSGGGMVVGGQSEGTISHNVIMNNLAVAENAGYGEGGGLAAYGRALTITHNTIEANTACTSCFVAWGGGVSAGQVIMSPLTFA